MNSVMGIGEQILFMFQGEKLWEGSNSEIVYSGVKQVDDFVFTNKVMQSLKTKK
jgi:phospholipid/cholesterol/gamma-HCH transport system ATP-binding protein